MWFSAICGCPAWADSTFSRRSRARHPYAEVIIITAYGSVDSAIEAIQAGAFHYVTKPIKLAEIRALTSRALDKVNLIKETESLKKALFSQNRQSEHIIGHSPGMREVFRLIDKVSALNCNVLMSRGKAAPARKWWPGPFTSAAPGGTNRLFSFNCGGIYRGTHYQRTLRA